jgi:hypothetical protein
MNAQQERPALKEPQLKNDHIALFTESQGKNAERLLEVLEELRLILQRSLPPVPAPRKKLSWDDVWRKTTSGLKAFTTTAHVSQGRSEGTCRRRVLAMK